MHRHAKSERPQGAAFAWRLARRTGAIGDIRQDVSSRVAVRMRPGRGEIVGPCRQFIAV
jgi:hypothetical protein